MTFEELLQKYQQYEGNYDLQDQRSSIYNAMYDLSDDLRFAANNTEDPAAKQSFNSMADTLDAISVQPPQTFDSVITPALPAAGNFASFLFRPDNGVTNYDLIRSTLDASDPQRAANFDRHLQQVNDYFGFNMNLDFIRERQEAEQEVQPQPEVQAEPQQESRPEQTSGETLYSYRQALEDLQEQADDLNPDDRRLVLGNAVAAVILQQRINEAENPDEPVISDAGLTDLFDENVVAYANDEITGRRIQQLSNEELLDTIRNPQAYLRTLEEEARENRQEEEAEPVREEQPQESRTEQEDDKIYSYNYTLREHQSGLVGPDRERGLLLRNAAIALILQEHINQSDNPDEPVWGERDLDELYGPESMRYLSDEPAGQRLQELNNEELYNTIQNPQEFLNRLAEVSRENEPEESVGEAANEEREPLPEEQRLQEMQQGTVSEDGRAEYLTEDFKNFLQDEVRNGREGVFGATVEQILPQVCLLQLAIDNGQGDALVELTSFADEAEKFAQTPAYKEMVNGKTPEEMREIILNPEDFARQVLSLTRQPRPAAEEAPEEIAEDTASNAVEEEEIQEIVEEAPESSEKPASEELSGETGETEETDILTNRMFLSALQQSVEDNPEAADIEDLKKTLAQVCVLHNTVKNGEGDEPLSDEALAEQSARYFDYSAFQGLTANKTPEQLREYIKDPQDFTESVEGFQLRGNTTEQESSESDLYAGYNLDDDEEYARINEEFEVINAVESGKVQPAGNWLAECKKEAIENNSQRIPDSSRTIELATRVLAIRMLGNIKRKDTRNLSVDISEQDIDETVEKLKKDSNFQKMISRFEKSDFVPHDPLYQEFKNGLTTGNGGRVEDAYRKFLKELPAGQLENGESNLAHYMPTAKERIESLQQQLRDSMKAEVDKSDPRSSEEASDKVKESIAEIVLLRNMVKAERNKAGSLDKKIPMTGTLASDIKTVSRDPLLHVANTRNSVKEAAISGHGGNIVAKVYEETRKDLQNALQTGDEIIGDDKRLTSLNQYQLPSEKADKLFGAGTVGGRIKLLKDEADELLTTLQDAEGEERRQALARSKEVIAEFLLFNNRLYDKYGIPKYKGDDFEKALTKPIAWEDVDSKVQKAVSSPMYQNVTENHLRAGLSRITNAEIKSSLDLKADDLRILPSSRTSSVSEGPQMY